MAKKKKATGRTFVILALVLIVLVGAFVGSKLFSTAPADKANTDRIVFTVEKGQSGNRIIANLKEQGLIADENAFKLYLKRNKLEGSLRAGSYLLSPSMTMEEIVDELLNGVGEMFSITIPEGYTLRDIADLFAEKEVMDRDTFWNLVKNYDISGYVFADCAPAGEHRLEGFMFPETYSFGVGSSPELVFKVILDQFQKEWNNMPKNESGLNFYDTIKLASMVESEAKFDSERADIASVYINRLKIGMAMQCDATILYGMPERKTQLRFKDYEYQTEYNTYLHPGLPPTPISNPGRESLKAACQPASTDYLYYLWNTKDKNGHVFANSYEGHLKNRKTYGYDK